MISRVYRQFTCVEGSRSFYVVLRSASLRNSPDCAPLTIRAPHAYTPLTYGNLEESYAINQSSIWAMRCAQAV